MSPRPLERGVWGVLATPFAGPELALDEASLAREVAWYREMGATGIVALGVFGEAARLDGRERRRALAVVAAERGPLPVVVGLPALAAAQAIDEASVACEALGDGLAGVMVQVPMPEPRRLVAHFTAIYRATGAGVVVQDYPLSSGVQIAPGALVEAVRGCPFVVGIKCEAAPTAVAIATVRAGCDVPAFGGLGGVGLVDELAAGAAGAMTGFSQPEGLLAACRAFAAGGFAPCRAAFRRWLPIATFEAQPGIGLALRKEVLRRRGVIAEAGVRPPAMPLPQLLVPLLDAHLAALAADR